MTLSIGSRLGPYEILSRLGAGGMGEVYRARDTRLERHVAIKVLSEPLAGDPHWLGRFQREARAIAALSHPNILAIHDFGCENDVSYAVMELLEGESLRARLEQGPIPWRRAVEVGIAVADGLSAAHVKGIVHRDLKPDNIFLTSDDRAKILDFGLVQYQQAVADAPTAGPTPTETLPGTVMGTVGYMSPEQVRAETIDARTDIFSFGCVLHEMLTGRRAFQGRTAADTMAAILNAEPAEASESGPSFPQALVGVVGRCLQKNPGSRFQTASDLAFALKEALKASEAASIRGASSSGSHRRPLDSIAVLPFSNVGGDPDAEYLSDGIAESIILSLSRLPNLRVMARSVLSRYKGREIDPQGVGEELKVGAVLTGRVFHRGESLIIKTELVDVRDGTQIWGENYDRKFTDILALEAEISREISRKLRLKVTGEDGQQPSRLATASPEAYRLYLKGLFYWNKRTADGFRKGIDLFRQAIELDPEYAIAYAGIAHSYNQLGFYQHLSPQEAFPKARAAATRALELDKSLGEARSVLAVVRFWYDWDWSGAEEDFLCAIAASPDFVHVHQFYGIFLTAMERFADGLLELRRAIELDPLSLPARASLGFCLYMARQYDEAILELEKILEMDSSFVVAHLLLSWNYVEKRMWTEATQSAIRASELSSHDTFRLSSLGACLAASGRHAEAESILAELGESSSRRYASAAQIALVHVALGHPDLAFDWLEKAFAERAWSLVLLKVDPRADPLRADPRFAELLQRIGL